MNSSVETAEDSCGNSHNARNSCSSNSRNSSNAGGRRVHRRYLRRAEKRAARDNTVVDCETTAIQSDTSLTDCTCQLGYADDGGDCRGDILNIGALCPTQPGGEDVGSPNMVQIIFGNGSTSSSSISSRRRSSSSCHSSSTTYSKDVIAQWSSDRETFEPATYAHTYVGVHDPGDVGGQPVNEMECSQRILVEDYPAVISQTEQMHQICNPDVTAMVGLIPVQAR